LKTVQDILSSLFEFPSPGFIRCLEGAGQGDHTRPNWPLMVMGPQSTASVGIAIGHVRTPMHDVIQAARDAEHIAKGVEKKGALCVKVLKRSGESVEFAARFNGGTVGLWGEIEHLGADLSGRFIYRFMEKATPILAAVRDGRAGWETTWEGNGIDLREIVAAELTDTILGQTELHREKGPARRAECRKQAERWIAALQELDPKNFVHFWMARAFLNRLDKSGKETANA
jgi:hypothetical protein